MNSKINQAGEMEVKINGNKHYLKCTFLGLVEMENRAGMGQGGLSYRIMSKTVGIRDITALIYGGIIGKCGPDMIKPPIEFDELGEQIMRHGVSLLIPACEEFLIYAMTGGKEDDEPVKKKA